MRAPAHRSCLLEFAFFLNARARALYCVIEFAFFLNARARVLILFGLSLWFFKARSRIDRVCLSLRFL